jgi:hypothetical protein
MFLEAWPAIIGRVSYSGHSRVDMKWLIDVYYCPLPVVYASKCICSVTGKAENIATFPFQYQAV